MPTAESVKEKLLNLISLSNTTTGRTDETLTDAVNALIDGFGSGGGSTGGLNGIYMAQVTLDTDSDNIRITHNLGTTDIIMATCFAQTLGDIVPSFAATLVKFFAKTDIPVRVTPTENGVNYDSSFNYNTTYKYAQGAIPTNEKYRSEIVDENTFNFKRAASSYKFIAGVTYTIIIISADAEV